jgi:hypothetical protein
VTLGGWARRTGVKSIVFHYVRDGVTICPNHWPADPAVVLVAVVTDGLCCPYCVAMRTAEVGPARTSDATRLADRGSPRSQRPIRHRRAPRR